MRPMNEKQFTELSGKLERFVNIQNQRNEFFRKFFTEFKIIFPPNVSHIFIETKWIAASILLSSIIVSITIAAKF